MPTTKTPAKEASKTIGTKTATITTGKDVELMIPKVELRTMTVRVIGDSMLVTHKWSEKAIKMMLDKQTKQAKTAKQAKVPEEDFLSTLYCLDDAEPTHHKLKNGKVHAKSASFGFPAIAFKKAAVDAASFVDGVTKVAARGTFQVIGELVPLIYDEKKFPIMRQDMCRVGMGTADIRFRAEFTDWQADLLVRYNPAVLSAEQVVNLFNIAGFSVGVGEQRPQKNGQWGMFHVATSGE